MPLIETALPAWGAQTGDRRSWKRRRSCACASTEIDAPQEFGHRPDGTISADFGVLADLRAPGPRSDAARTEVTAFERSHNPRLAGSNPAPATHEIPANPGFGAFGGAARGRRAGYPSGTNLYGQRRCASLTRPPVAGKRADLGRESPYARSARRPARGWRLACASSPVAAPPGVFGALALPNASNERRSRRAGARGGLRRARRRGSRPGLRGRVVSRNEMA